MLSIASKVYASATKEKSGAASAAAVYDKFGDTELITLVREGDVKKVTKGLKNPQIKVQINKGNDAGLTPLHFATILGKIDLIRLLIKNGAVVNVKNKLGNTPLHDAARGPFVDIFKVLKNEYEADISINNEDGRTPCDLILLEGHKSQMCPPEYRLNLRQACQRHLSQSDKRQLRKSSATG